MSKIPAVARRMAHIQPFYVMDLLARARALEAQGRSIIHMEIGEPDFITPAPIIEAGQRALSAGHTHYTPALGLPALRQGIAASYQLDYGIAVEPSRVLVTPGSSGALQLVMSVLINPGDAVLMADPGYPCNRHFVRLVEGIPISVPVGSGTGYQLTADLVGRAWTPQTRAVLVASPSNPTGTLLSAKALREIYQIVKARGGVLIVDEIYQGLIYDGEGCSALSIADDIFVINSFSKFYGMTGWRLGWVVAPPGYVEPMDRLAQNIFLAASTLSQHAALEAFSDEVAAILEERRREYRQRRDYLLPALQSLGFDIPVVPGGAFYLYAGSRRLTPDSFKFAQSLLNEAGVAVTPGRDFGDHKPEQHIRFAYTTCLANLAEGVERIKCFLSQ
ncbi:MAG: pyridoxal phosphate-dependent aminotransferase [Candidatus Polarisedimenticolaceae bacterium]|nr:pyridoxal phosphate-dependent aminotransferase [Candidatus Polarisedimenticolaceae bacterium]